MRCVIEREREGEGALCVSPACVSDHIYIFNVCDWIMYEPFGLEHTHTLKTPLLPRLSSRMSKSTQTVRHNRVTVPLTNIFATIASHDWIISLSCERTTLGSKKMLFEPQLASAANFLFMCCRLPVGLRAEFTASARSCVNLCIRPFSISASHAAW